MEREFSMCDTLFDLCGERKMENEGAFATVDEHLINGGGDSITEATDPDPLH